MFDHMGFCVRDLARARTFYEATMPTIGLKVADNGSQSFLVGRSAAEAAPFLWIGTQRPDFWGSEHRASQSPVHLAFTASSREQVAAFHAAGLAAGGRDNGRPGPRGPESMGYYAAFLLDPDGNNIEAGLRNPAP